MTAAPGVGKTELLRATAAELASPAGCQPAEDAGHSAEYHPATAALPPVWVLSLAASAFGARANAAKPTAIIARLQAAHHTCHTYQMLTLLVLLILLTLLLGL